MVLAPLAPSGRFEFHVGTEVASIVDGETQPGPIEDPDVLVEGDAEGLYHMFVDRRLDLVTIRGNRAKLKALIEAAPEHVELPVPA